MKYRAEIDGLRAVAVLPVILFHAGFEWFSGGFVGVDVFFVISGYLITTIIISEMYEGKFSILNFYERRARRILPALFLVMAVCLPFALLWLTPSDLKDFGESLVFTATFSSNILFWWETDYFATASELKPLLHTWSLAVEEQFYILFPPLLLFIWKFGNKKITLLLTVIMLMSLGLAHFASVYGVFGKVISGAFFLIPTRIWEMLVGVLVAFFLHNKHWDPPRFQSDLAGFLGLIMIVVSITQFDDSLPFPSVYTLLPVLGTALIIIYAGTGSIIKRLLSVRPLVALGLISYSAYLWHQPIFAFSRYKFADDVTKDGFLLLSLISILLAYVSWKWVEVPFRSRSHLTRKQILTVSVIGLLIFSAVGGVLSLTYGLLNTRPPIERNIYQEFINLGKNHRDNMQAVRLRQFDRADERTKLLVIGDSHAEDLVNAIVESELHSVYQLSTYYIPASCGVLFIEQENISTYQPTGCYGRPNFFNEPLIWERFQEADHVWIVSSWQQWQVQFMAQSLSRMKERNDNLTLFGSKAFEINSASQFKNQFGISGLTRKFDITDRHKRLNVRLQEIASLTGVRYINTMAVICGSSTTCQHSFDGENIISVDGGHLTKYGANHFGRNLFLMLSEKR